MAYTISTEDLGLAPEFAPLRKRGEFTESIFGLHFNWICSGYERHEVWLRGRWMLVDNGCEHQDTGMLHWGIYYEVRPGKAEYHDGWSKWGNWRRVAGLPKPLPPINKRECLDRELNRRLGNPGQRKQRQAGGNSPRFLCGLAIALAALLALRFLL